MRQRSALLLALLAGSAALAAIDGCTIVNGLSVPTDAAAADRPAPGEGGDAQQPGDGCNHAKPPPPPKVADTADNIVVVAVAKQLLLSSDPSADPVGYDLDDKCSDPQPESCVGTNPHPDPGGRGVDNNGGSLFVLVKSRTDIEERVNDGILRGKNSILLRIAGYNGKPDDPAVTISVYASPGLFDGTGNNMSPKFVATEGWSLDTAQFSAVSPDLPTTTTPGYVANGTVVGFLSATIAISGSFSLTFNSAVLTAELDLSGPTPTVKSGIIAGRWPASDLLRAVARQRTSDGGPALCDDKLSYSVAKKIICDQLDIRSDRATDNKMLACDATSASLRFIGAPASLGPHRASPIDEPCPGFAPDGCGDGG